MKILFQFWKLYVAMWELFTRKGRDVEPHFLHELHPFPRSSRLLSQKAFVLELNQGVHASCHSSNRGLNFTCLILVKLQRTDLDRINPTSTFTTNLGSAAVRSPEMQEQHNSSPPQQQWVAAHNKETQQRHVYSNSSEGMASRVAFP